ncbi:MAG: 30S ribosomal protein S16 [Nocardioides sp.]|uniref:30S ribosomal protein S16 n=1 Tax=Nocardioides sp. TaxID=35761 RepID=UPI003D6B2AE2
MAVKIRLKRLGKIRVPQYRIVIVDSRKKRDGAVIEEIGLYRPKEEPSFIQVDSERAQYWLGVGAQPTPALEAILKVTGDWQKFKGLPGAEGTLRFAPPKPDKLELFNKALAEAHASAGSEAVTKKAKKDEKAEEPKVEKAEAVTKKAKKSDEPKAEKAEKVEEPKAEETPAEEPKAEEPKAEETPASAEAEA